VTTTYPKIAQLKHVDRFLQRQQELGIEIPCDSQLLSAAAGSPLAEPFTVGEFQVGNRWCIQPMEGWDGERNGQPSELNLRRWERFGCSGAKLIWGGEAAAVQHDGRANPNQLLATPEHTAGLRKLLTALRQTHRERFGRDDDLLVGLQLTHSGRFSRPNGSQAEPRIAYHHPLLDKRVGISAEDDSAVWSDSQLQQLVERYVEAAQVAFTSGFQFVDIKACHGYLLHEFLTAHQRPGQYGGDLQGRSRLLCQIIAEVRRTLPELMIGVRLSLFDWPPFQSVDGVGQMCTLGETEPYRYAFGSSPQDPTIIDMREPLELVSQLKQLGVVAINLSCGSPYYVPHIQRPAIFPPSDGYPPPEDPLVGVARQIRAVAAFKQACPDLPTVGSGYTYLQEFLPLVAQAVVRQGWVDSVGIGRMVLSYPELPADALAGQTMARKQICRTFSDCTTGPRRGLISGCFPLDPFYKKHPAHTELNRHKGGEST